jgi:hypothetical protein
VGSAPSSVSSPIPEVRQKFSYTTHQKNGTLGKQEQPAETGSRKGLRKKWNELVPANTIREKCVN